MAAVSTAGIVNWPQDKGFAPVDSMKETQMRFGVGRLLENSRGLADVAPVPVPELTPQHGDTVVRVMIRSAEDVLSARKAGRISATAVGFRDAEITAIVTAISEVARNIVEYANSGEVIMLRIQKGNERGLRIIAVDKGRGIGDVQAVMEAGYVGNSERSMGLSRAKWLMDAFEIDSQPGQGTTVTMVKWVG
jgi:serine/threonine-protein kinase RsbT